jgi:hypothetical protein
VPRVRKTSRPPNYRLSQASFLEHCRHLPDIAGLGHVARPLHRHFSAYLNAASIVDTPSRLRDLIAGEMLGSILGSGGPDVVPPDFRMFYVGSSRDYAAKLAGLVASRLNAHYPDREKLEPQEIPRAIAGQTYAFPDDLAEPPVDRDVILIDWGSFDATTILQMIRLAAEGGARRIVVLVLLSQMGRHEERALTMTRAVDDPARPGTVPVEIRFVTSLSITPMLPGDCSLCELIGDMRANLRALSLPYEVATHVAALADVLGPRSREDVLRSGLDVFGSPITTDDAFEFIRLRGELLAARRDTGDADRLARGLAALEVQGDGPRIGALMRLLAAERRWLAQLPLSLTQCLDQVSRLAREVVLERQFHERLRLQALVVLAVSDPEELIASLFRIWRSALDYPVLIHQALYELWATLDTGLRHSRKAQHLLRKNVVSCMAVGLDEYSDPHFGKTVQRLLVRLRDRVEVTSDVEPPRTPMDAWAFLRANYLAELYRHTEAETAAINLLVLFDSPPVGTEMLDDQTWDTAQLLWQQVSSFVGTRVLPAMSSLSEITTGRFARRFFTDHPGYGMPDLISAQVSASLRAVETKLHDLRGEKADSAPFRDAWQEVNDEVTRWYHAVLAPGTRTAPEALLARFVDGCPTNLGVVLEDCAAGSSVEVSLESGDNLDTFVFCHSDLMRDALRHIFDLVRTGTADSGDPVPPRVRVRTRHGAHATRLHFRAAGLPESDPSASATDWLAGQLTEFDGSLEYRDAASYGDPEIVLEICRWTPQVAEDWPT